MADVVIRDLFDPEDLVDQWVFSLSATAADLAAAESVFKDHLDGDGPSVRSQYYFRQLLARIYESERVVAAATEIDEVRDFVGTVDQAEAALAALVADFLPIDSSRAREVLGYSRHRTVHHAFVGSEELAADLEAAGDQPARILVDHGNERLLHEFPEAVLSHALAPDIDTTEGKARFAERVRFAAKIVENFGRLLTPVLAAHVATKNVDPGDLYVEI